jgi:hypothetical protein
MVQQNVVVGNVRNNILLAGSAISRYAGYEEAPVGSTAKPKFFENNNLFGSATLYVTWNGNAAAQQSDASQVNLNVNFATNNISVDLSLDATFHISTSSLCVDKGTNIEAPAKDMEGQPRMADGDAVDIGADEAD